MTRTLRIADLEPRLMLSGYRFDFGTTTSPTASGFLGVPVLAYSAARGYGWNTTAGVSAVDRGTSNALTRDFHTAVDDTFRVNLPNGTYQVTLSLGDASQLRDSIDVYVNGGKVASNVTTQIGQVVQQNYTAQVTNGQLTLRLVDNGGKTSGWALDSVEVVPKLPSFHFDFGTKTSPVAAGYVGVPVTAYDSTKGYGWTSTTSLSAVDRATSNALTRDFLTDVDNTFRVNMPNGYYRVTTYLGDALRLRDNIDEYVNGNRVASNVTTQIGQFIQQTFDVQVTNGQLTLRLLDNGGQTSGWALDALDITSTSVAKPVVSAGSNQTAKEGSPVKFQGTINATAPYQYSWQFGDGTTATGTLTPTHVYADNGIYTAVLTVTDAFGVTNQSSAQVTVSNVPPVVALTGVPTLANEGAAIALGSNVTDPSSTDVAAGLQYAWSVTKNGDPFGAPGTQHSFSFTPDDNATYVVTLIVTDKDGGSGTASATLNVADVAPTVTMTGAPASANEGDTIALGSTVTDAVAADIAAGFTYAWTVTKNGNAFALALGTQSGFSFTPDDNGSYLVSLTATDKDGLTSTAATASIVVGNVAPTAGLTGVPAAANEGDVISLGSTVTDPGSADTAAGFTYAWSVTKNLNPFKTATGALPNFSFTPDDNGTYVVSLIVTDKDGGTSSTVVSSDIAVANVAPVASLTGVPTTADEGASISLGSKVIDPGSADVAQGFTYAWSVTKNDDPFASGSGTSPTFSFTPDDIGSYVASLTVTDKDGSASNSASATIDIVNAALAVGLTGVPTTATEGEAISLGSNVTDPSSVDTQFTYAWSVTKDGNPFASGTLATFSFTPDDNGLYVVSLRADGEDGKAGADSASITVGNAAPAVNLTGIPVNATEGTAISLGSTVTDAGAADVAAGFTYAWSVTKNGNPFVSASGAVSGFTFTPDDNGTYVVGLTVKDKDGAAASAASTTITVLNVNPRPNTLGSYVGQVGTPVKFTGIVLDPIAADVAAGFSYAWAFGDGGTATGATPGHSYAAVGTYTVTLTVTDKDGGVQSATTTATIGPVGSLVVPSTEYQFLSTNLLANTVYSTQSWSDMAADGSWSVNTQWEQGKSTSWYIELQRYGEDLIIGGMIQNNTAAINAGFAVFDWGFALQAADGSFAGTGDPFHSTSMFVDAVAHTLLVIEQSPYAQQFQSRVNTYVNELYKAATWMTGASVWTTGLKNDSPFTHRRYFVADALGLTSLLVGGDANLMSSARAEISAGLSLQWTNGVDPEKGGFDASYQMVGLSLAERWVTYFPNDSLTPAVASAIEKGLQWEQDTVLLPSGQISTAGSTRTGVESGRNGSLKTVDWKRTVDAFAYWYQLTGESNWQTDGRDVAEFYYRQY